MTFLHMPNVMTRTKRAIALATLALAACNRGSDAGKPLVALVPKTMNNPFFVDMARGAQAAADSLGLELVVQAPERELDPNGQMQIVENLIERGVKVLAIVPNGSREVVPAIVKATRARIPVVNVDTRLDTAALRAAGATVATFIGSDNVDGGRLAGTFLAGQIGGSGDVAVLEGVPGHETSDSRLRGFREAIARFPGVHVVSSQPANMERDQAFTVMQNTLQAHPTLEGVFAANDVMALGAVEAIAARRAGTLTVVGFDAADDARQAIRDGKLAASVAQHPAEMGRRAIESAWRLLHGEHIPAEQPVAIELITKANAGTP
jgi:ribose transport system substrate-binding protein